MKTTDHDKDDAFQAEVATLPRTERDALYRQTTQLIELFLGWRHKVMMFTFAVNSALLGLSVWMYEHDLGRAIAGPLLFAALLAAASSVFDGRNQRILDGCYEIGEAIERTLGLHGRNGPLGRIPVRGRSLRAHLLTYHGALQFAYRGLCIALLGSSAAIALCPPSPPAGI